ncbi:MAG: hypothetical protein K6G18_08325 [Treponema sp.]|nr:hypothetical protein [Treponema sp.]
MSPQVLSAPPEEFLYFVHEEAQAAHAHQASVGAGDAGVDEHGPAVVVHLVAIRVQTDVLARVQEHLVPDVVGFLLRVHRLGDSVLRVVAASLFRDDEHCAAAELILERGQVARHGGHGLRPVGGILAAQEILQELVAGHGLDYGHGKLQVPAQLVVQAVRHEPVPLNPALLGIAEAGKDIHRKGGNRSDNK